MCRSSTLEQAFSPHFQLGIFSNFDFIFTRFFLTFKLEKQTNEKNHRIIVAFDFIHNFYIEKKRGIDDESCAWLPFLNVAVFFSLTCLNLIHYIVIEKRIQKRYEKYRLGSFICSNRDAWILARAFMVFYLFFLASKN